jgi:phosphoribosylformimino-5-aminoimidazole carboxamide ribotide isomerase
MQLLIIPAIDLTQGHALRCIRGVEGTEQLYSEISDHPVELAQLWRRENAKCIHVTDIDSLRGVHDPRNTQSVIDMQRAVDVPIQFISRQTSIAEYRALLDAGVYRVAINVEAWNAPEETSDLVKRYGASRVIFSVRGHDGTIDVGNGERVPDDVYIRHVAGLGAQRIIYTEVDWEGNLSGEDVDTILRIADVAKLRITMAGGIASPEHLWELQQRVPRNVDSVVIGRAMYENRFPCQNIWRIAEAALEPEIHAHVARGTVQSSISMLDTPCAEKPKPNEEQAP